MSHVLELFWFQSRKQHQKIVALYPRKVSIKTVRVLMNDFEVLFRSNKSKTDICLYCKVVDDTAHFLFSCLSYQEHRSSFIEELKNRKLGETLVSLLNIENKHVISSLAGFIANLN